MPQHSSPRYAVEHAALIHWTSTGMMMRFLDTNILLYSISRDPTELKLAALELIDAASYDRQGMNFVFHPAKIRAVSNAERDHEEAILAKRTQNIPRYFKALMIPSIRSIHRSAPLFPSCLQNIPISSSSASPTWHVS
jgi:hypothetical protein